MTKYFLTPVLFLISCFAIIGQPTSDAVFEKIEKTYTLNEDGSIDYSYYKKLKLLTHLSFNRLYGETFIVYNPLHQQLKINKAIITQKDGKVVTAPVNAFNEVLPQFAADAPYYNYLREMVVTHAGTEIDAVIELDYTIHSDPNYFPALMADEVLVETSPILEETIIIRVPDWKNLYFKVFNLRTVPVVTKSDGFNEYHFTFIELKEDTHEPGQPSDNSHLPRLVFSTFSAVASQHFLAQQDALQYKANQSMKDEVAKIKKESKDDLSVVLKIQDLVVNNINTYSIPGEFTGFVARNPIETWNSNGGTPFEKCLLMTTLYREAGINAEPLMVEPTSVLNDTVGVLNQVTDYLVQVNARELEQIILSPVVLNDQNLTYSMAGKTMFVLNEKKPQIFKPKEKYLSKIELEGSFVLNDSMAVRGHAELLLSELANPFYKIKKDSSAAKQLIGGGLTAKDITSFKLINSSQVRSNIKFDFLQKQPVKNQKNYYFCNLPQCKNGSDSWHINYLSAERITPFELPFSVDEQCTLTFTIPDDVKLVNQLELTEVKTGFGELALSILQNGNKIIVKRNLTITEKVIPVSDYKVFKQMMDLWNEAKYRELVLKK
jgi:hypothetical protein